MEATLALHRALDRAFGFPQADRELARRDHPALPVHAVTALLMSVRHATRVSRAGNIEEPLATDDKRRTDGAVGMLRISPHLVAPPVALPAAGARVETVTFNPSLKDGDSRRHEAACSPIMPPCWSCTNRSARPIPSLATPAGRADQPVAAAASKRQARHFTAWTKRCSSLTAPW